MNPNLTRCKYSLQFLWMLLLFGGVFSHGRDSSLNVLFIAIDDLKPHLGAYGDSLALTPQIDRLAEEGVTFGNNHCQWAVCGASRASMTTGLMPEEIGVFGFTPMRANLPKVTTLPQHFRANGYETAATGKIHDYRTVGEIVDPKKNTRNGSQTDDLASWSIPYVKASSGFQVSMAMRKADGKKVKKAAEKREGKDDAFNDGKIATEGVSLLKELAKQFKAKGKPFFLGVGFKKPHLPFFAPKRYWDLYDRNDFEPHAFQKPPLNAAKQTINRITELHSSYYIETDVEGSALPVSSEPLPVAQQKELLHGYYACISFVDAQVGRLLDALEEEGLRDNTIVILWSDHGFHLGDHNEWGKHTNLEQATRSPLIISAPGFGSNGAFTNSPSQLMDMYPTLCDLAGLPLPEQPLDSSSSSGRPLRGRSLRPALENPAQSVHRGSISHFNTGGSYGYAIRTERYRYVEWINKENVIVGRELYDYEEDPMETVNRAGDAAFGALVNTLAKQLRDAPATQGCDRLQATPLETL